MTVNELIEKLKNAIKHGLEPRSDVMAWDPDIEEWLPIETLTYSQEEVRLYTGTENDVDYPA